MSFNIINKVIDNCLVKLKIKRGTFAVDINSIHGIGAKLIWVLEILAYCEEKNLRPRFKFSYPDTEDYKNYFDMFFEINDSSGHNDFIKIKSIGELGLDKNYNNVLNFNLSSYLIDKYLVIKDDVLSEVDKFYAKNFGNNTVLGVHYRGTDKSLEAPYVPYDRVERNINYYLEKYPETDAIFLSSDDENFIDYIKKCSVNRPVCYRDDSFRSADDAAIHHSGQDKYEINRDAIINALILSKCDALMKTSSILSAWSKLLRPELPLIMLNQPYNDCRWFPERELMKDVLFEPVP
ncbi:MAG: hypothetical protein KJO03_05735 [Gammaproteobacteria bacterium]|nr:hypothetical protein [Gammaproteobacteria bacterium]